MRFPLTAGSTSGTVSTVGGMVPRQTKGKAMAHYLVIGGRSKKRFDRYGKETFSEADNAKLASITLASCAAHVVSTREKEPAEVWRISPGHEAQVAVYFPPEEAEKGGRQ